MKTIEELVAFSAQVEGQGIEDHQNCTYTRPELAALALAVSGLPRRARVVEIGTFAGRSTSLYFQAQPDLDLDIHLIDNWSWNAKFATQAFASLVIDHFSDIPFTLHKMRSDDLGMRWGIGIRFIDLLHIDGWHDMPGIEPDCRLWLPWVVPGGIAAFHDSQSPDVATCIGQYIKGAGWTLVSEAGRTTVWRKPRR